MALPLAFFSLPLEDLFGLPRNFPPLLMEWREMGWGNYGYRIEE
uniref:Uncharacterized protein n=1 Tax=Coccidioides posadasii RMSCC 3488 TaxID=454284 RepID=A0A0J6FS07_COCPO|nr:hypothetical protein CPAG_09437 [Coccidioides posadasii RMSCC 3488]